MDPVIDNEWLGCKNEPIDEMQNVGNVSRSWQWRERGLNPPHCPPNKTVLQNAAEDILVQKTLQIRSCDLPGYPRSTFLMVFSPDGSKVASTHGNHNVYVSELASGRHVRILKGHPRTPWCIAFHPSHPLLIGSGCLGGQVRVWDIASGGSEVWNVRSETVIASIAFHPRDQLLVIATYNELYFWDWSQPAPFTKVCTNNVNEKVRYVAFDALGYKLITGISLWACPVGAANNSLLQQNPTMGPTNNQSGNGRRDNPDDSPGGARPQEPAGSTQDMIVNSYQNLVQRYDSLVRNYQRLFMVRHRLTNTPPPPSTIDRGTDPMETDVSPGAAAAWPSTAASTSSTASTASTAHDDANPSPGTSRQPDPAPDNPEGEASSSRLLNLDVLSFNSNQSFRSRHSNLERALFGSPSSAFQPLIGSERTFRTVDQNERTRLLPNPFSSTGAGTARPPRVSFSGEAPESNTTNSSRTSIFTSSRSGAGLGRDFAFRRRNFPPSQNRDTTNNNPSTSTSTDAGRPPPLAPVSGPTHASSPISTDAGRPPPLAPMSAHAPSPISTSTDAGRSPPLAPESGPAYAPSPTSTAAGRPPPLASVSGPAHALSPTSTSTAAGRPPPLAPVSSPARAPSPAPAPRPATTNSSTQMSPLSAPVDAQTINESLELIRDILRDSGTRLLNLITNMSLSTLASVERGAGARSRWALAAEGRCARPRPRPRARPRPPGPVWRRDPLSSSSDSDSDRSSEVNIFRTRNSTFREDEPAEPDRTARSTSADGPSHPTDRMVFELNAESHAGDRPPSRDSGGINVSLSNNRFRVRIQSDSIDEDAGVSSAAARPAEPPTAAAGFAGAASTAPAENAGVSSTVPGDVGVSSTDAGDAGVSAAAVGDAGVASANTRDAGTGPARGEWDVPEFDPDEPSTSRDDFWSRGGAVPPDEAYRRVRSGVNALQKHTTQLTNLWLRGNRTTMRELRTMWENLRRRILTLHRETGRQDVPSYYTRPLLDRCMMLTDMTENLTRSTRNPRTNPRNEDNERLSAAARNASLGSENPNGANEMEREASAASVGENDNRPTQTGRSQVRSATSVRSPSLRRRLQANYRWRAEEELRRRSRNPTANRLAPRFTNRSRRDFARAIEISATRHEIRMRAMQVLSVMFNMMMMCLEERGLSQLIIYMLRTLKRALALTCLIVMSNRNTGRTGGNTAPVPQHVESLDVVRIQNVEHTGPVNVDGPDELLPHNVSQSTAELNASGSQNKKGDRPAKNNPESEKPSTSKSAPDTNKNMQTKNPPTSPPNSVSQRWSNRLAVQIAAANRNISATARNRREHYIESRRQRALHRTNPAAHPITKKRVSPPVSNYRIPALRSLPGRTNVSRVRTPRGESQNEPVAGPSNAPPYNANPILQESPNNEMNEFEHRVNFIRIAHMQAVRLRNAARNRFRRLQTIRLYTPSSIREMFSLHTNHGEGQREPHTPGQSNPEDGNRHPLALFRPHILTPRGDASRPDELGQRHAVLNNVTMPLMQVNDPPTAAAAVAEAQGAQPQRLPRIHEYLQPIILAQNAMVMEEEGSGGGGGGGRRAGGVAGLLDAGIISEALPAPSHRVQAWDFTTGDAPQISDSTKNVVVQRCRIHNDASIDISKDGRLLVALLPVPRLRNTNHWLGVYSLEWARLGQCLHTAVLEQAAVSVALSPTARHLAVGLGSRRFTTAPHNRNNIFALLYRLEPLESSSRTGLSPIKELEQHWEHGFTSLNCLRWAPQPGQGLVYANNTGQLIVMS